MTDLQRIEFDMLKEFVNICDTLGIKYYLVCGSALGAVKYEGFIPWDDDLDVGLLRGDYEVFISKAQSYLPNHYFLQNYRTDKFAPFFMSKIRYSNTTCIEYLYQNIDMNHGIYIDVFPLDGYPISQNEAKHLEHKKSAFLRTREARYEWRSFTAIRTNLVKIAFRCFNLFSNTAKIIERFEKIASSYRAENSTLWCNHGNWQGKLEYAPKEQYGNGTWAMFEGIKVRIPENYDAYLTQKYGDWRSDPPSEKQNSGHDFMIVDTTRPYTEYIVKLKNGIIRLKTSEELLSSGITPPEGYKY